MHLKEGMKAMASLLSVDSKSLIAWFLSAEVKMVYTGM